MKITPVDHHHNLFLVENFYPQELVDAFLATDHLQTPHSKVDMQYEYPRRGIDRLAGDIYTQIDQYTRDHISTISEAIGADLANSVTGFWLDEAGFSMTPHLDNENVEISMQIYMNENDAELGTTFFESNKRTPRFRPLYKPNTGYIMINGPDQYHGCAKKVPVNTYRISTYTWFSKKS